MSEKIISLLIVDDDPVFSLFVRQLVLSLGDELPCRVSCADSAEAALAEIQRGQFDIALLDYHLPGRSGLDLLGQIRALPIAQQPAVVMLTGSGNEAVAVEAMKRGARDYLQKNEVEVPSLMRAIQNARSQKRMADQVAAYDAQMKSDLNMARKLQEALLPNSYPAFPPTAPAGTSALRFRHRFFSASQLSGDFFSVQALSETQAGVLICDVTGHGVRSALVTAMLRALVGDLEADANDPARFLSGMNRKLARILKQIDETIYATAFYLVADVAETQIRFAKAGHPPPLHVQRQAGNVAPLQVPKPAGAALGLFENTTYITGQAGLAAGDVVLLFTDGLFEVANAADEDYGAERLQAAVRERMNLPLSDLMDGVIADVRNFSGDADFADDVCLLGMEVAGTGGSSYKSFRT